MDCSVAGGASGKEALSSRSSAVPKLETPMCLSTAAGVRQRNSRLCAMARGAGVPDEPLLLHRHHLAPRLVPLCHARADRVQHVPG